MPGTLEQEMQEGSARTGSAPQRLLARVRAWSDQRPWTRAGYKVLVAVVGTVTIVAGIAMLALPGPGWVTIFLGLSILATEFPYFRRVTDRVRAVVTRVWQRWQERRARRG